MQKLAKKQYKRMKKAVPQFDKKEHYLIVIDDMSGNIFEVIGAAGTHDAACTDVIPIALERIERDYEKHHPGKFQVGLQQNGRMCSWVV